MGGAGGGRDEMAEEALQSQGTSHHRSGHQCVCVWGARAQAQGEDAEPPSGPSCLHPPAICTPKGE